MKPEKQGNVQALARQLQLNLALLQGSAPVSPADDKYLQEQIPSMLVLAFCSGFFIGNRRGRSALFYQLALRTESLLF